MRDERHIAYMLHNITLLRDKVLPIFQKMVADEIWFAGVLFKLHTIAQAAQELRQETRDAMPDVDWPAIRGFRNRVVHEYLTPADIALIHAILQNDLPKLETALQKYLKEHSK